jgi:hypothetical protein
MRAVKAFIVAISLLAALQGICFCQASSESGELKLYRAVLSGAPETTKALTAKERQQLYDLVAGGDVTSLKALQKYDPENQIGFCFGRAMAVHLLARRMGLADGSIRKLFMTGCLGSGGKTEWRFHVAAMVKGDDGAWHAIETNVAERPLTARQWVEEMRKKWDPGRKARLYATSSSWVLPDVRTFREIADEKGTELIELSFDPSGRDGFRQCRTYGVELTEVDDRAAARYFIGTGEDAGNRFDFEQITINGEKYDYRGYFRDLLKKWGQLTTFSVEKWWKTCPKLESRAVESEDS